MRPNDKFVVAVTLAIATGCSGTDNNVATAPGDLFIEILDADDFDDLVAPIHYLRHRGNDEEITQFATLLLSRVESDKPLRFNPDWDSDEYFGFTYRNQPIGSCGEMHTTDESKRKRPRIRDQSHFSTTQDLGIEGGRCCWALERLYGIYLPPMLLGLKREMRARFAEETRQVVRQHMTLRPSAARHVQLSERERLKIIERSNLHPFIVLEMSKDESPIIRKMVAEHPNCYPYLFRRHEGFLQSDPHSDVAAAAARRTNRTGDVYPEIMLDHLRRQQRILAEVNPNWEKNARNATGSGSE